MKKDINIWIMLMVVFLVFFNLIVIESMFSNDIKKSQSLITGAVVGMNNAGFNTLFLIFINFIVIGLLIYNLRNIDRKKGQASMEMMGVYSWALLALVIVVAGFYFYNVFNPSKYMEQSGCEIARGISCLGYAVNNTGHIILILRNDMNVDMSNVDVKVDNCNNLIKSSFPKDSILQFLIRGCGTLTQDTKFKDMILIKYNVGSSTYQKSGTLETNVQGGLLTAASASTSTTISGTTSTIITTTTTTTIAYTIDLTIISSPDDARAYGSNALMTDASYEWMGRNNNYDEDTGLRFQNVNVPKGATITEAHIRFIAGYDQANIPVNLIIKGEASDNPGAFINGNRANYNSRPRTTASISWNPDGWTKDNVYDSPNIAPVIQELVNRPGWNSGSSLVLFVENFNTVNNYYRRAYAWDYNAAHDKAPHLFVTYVI